MLCAFSELTILHFCKLFDARSLNNSISSLIFPIANLFQGLLCRLGFPGIGLRCSLHGRVKGDESINYPYVVNLLLFLIVFQSTDVGIFSL